MAKFGCLCRYQCGTADGHKIQGLSGTRQKSSSRCCSCGCWRRLTTDMYFAPPQIELFCISVSWMCNQSLTPPFASLRLCVSASLRLCVKLRMRTQRRKGAKNKSHHVGDYVVWASRALVAVHSWSDRPYKKRSLCQCRI